MVRPGFLRSQPLAVLAFVLALASGVGAGAGYAQEGQGTDAPASAETQSPAETPAPAEPQGQPPAEPAIDAAKVGAGAAPATGGLSKSQTAGSTTGGKSITVSTPDSAKVDYAAWEQMGQRADRALADANTSNNGLELLRGQLVAWRTKFQTAQTANSSRITRLRDQISALGPVPAEGQSEAPEIAQRRRDLSEELSRLEAPGRAAEEAYRRANGLIAQIDAVLRDRQAKQLLKLWPSPANPANWEDAAIAVRDTGATIWRDLTNNWQRADRRAEMFDTLPVIGILLVMAVVLIWRGRVWIERFANWLQGPSRSGRWSRVLAFIASLGQIVVPSVGVIMVAVAALASKMFTGMAASMVEGLVLTGITLFTGIWLAARVFPKHPDDGGPLGFPVQTRIEARFHVQFMGLLLGLGSLETAIFPPAQLSEAAVPVMSLPLQLLLSLTLWRFGHLVNRCAGQQASDGSVAGAADAGRFRLSLIQIIAKFVIALAVVAPVLALIGYSSAASALLFPATASLFLIGLLLILVQLIGDLWGAVVPGDEDTAGQGLLPVLAGFLLTLVSLPVFALIWGARIEDLGELWNRFAQGFTIGETRISPSNFVYFLILFIIGYGATRLFQSALRSSILPKTKLDQGGRNAIVSGTGYVGIFLAALIAVSAAGIDLSGLAIVASALSVGIGFGLQNIVQNFVSGIILLIERPVSEGDWIEVGGVTGTVKSISVRSTRIQTFDRSDVIVPNADLVSQQVTNWTRFSLAGRVIVPVGVDYSSDTEQVARILREIAEAHPLVVLEPPPSVAFMGLGADALNFEIRMIIRDVNFSLSVRTEVNHAIVRRFREEGVAMPFSQRDIWLRNPEAVAEALAGLRAAVGGAGPVAPADGDGSAARPQPRQRDDIQLDPPADPRADEIPDFDDGTER
ncbi:small-conductance mechanosensitive channel [Gemmobacter caeni]|uniref:Small-conductance mechanosensitive channel n=1 Tax=Gemmobacter caeni TaxID=589035 RepID=A0A2T6AXK9_9RHOB|nr:DUF3772 domain-containing protein [Gemmobacter caeni]PTX48541.1 small-conductance mechanosensitive channel [Gemmobacter caeni]TWI99658.1 small-conductance mechanosensitive channel [Gemmobacter caeni]